MWLCFPRLVINHNFREKLRQTLFPNLNCLSVIRTYASTRELLLQAVQPPPPVGSNKVTVVGIGQVGMVCAFGILTQVSKIFNGSFMPYSNVGL